MLVMAKLPLRPHRCEYHNGTSDEGGGKTLVTWNDGDKSSVWADIEYCSTANKDEAPVTNRTSAGGIDAF